MRIDNGITVVRAMFLSRLAETQSEARRCICQNSVRVDGVAIIDTDAVIDFAGAPQLTIEVGSHRKHIFVE